MEAVLHNLESTVELLAVSQTDMVAKWDFKTVDRAFQWAQYCEHLHTRFHTNPSVRAALESRLHETNQLLAHTFTGYRCLTVSDLAQCRHRLFTGLLKNPATPHPLIKSLIEKFGVAENAECDQRLDVSGLSLCRSACKLLSDFTLNRKSDFNLSAGTHVHGRMLLQQIHATQSHPGNQAYATQLLDCFLGDSEKEQDHFLALVAAALLSTDTISEDTTAQDFLLNWLDGHDGLLHSMFRSLPSVLCTRLFQQWPKCRLGYWECLKKSASSLEYDVSNGLWKQSCDTAMSFLTLTDRIKSLWSSGSPLKEKT